MVELEITRLSEVQSTDVEWLWYPYIPFGKLTIIQGDPGSGKTRLRQRCQKGRETTSAPFLQTVKARAKEET